MDFMYLRYFIRNMHLFEFVSIFKSVPFISVIIKVRILTHRNFSIRQQESL